ncbi:hypothetical protein Hbl1158_01765 [Halobaculum sp. CBA1158]|uniref:Sjogren's syndrome/scleroderma autoantigen 1 family protein n=1 Tax=Halobaculum sp. CBA1158 TaxID=2904243 RepID=UPI001F29474F|nr:Sjogren's syndrome/scleroderma autoantigen 1 family protein [Halobaculum sp. CBA1158]UIP00125.1 hypothetical protein Hbl1158_01765 [Halobaculum sp. CBA1158]
MSERASDDTDDDSGFDKEAEREKLREKFARDERKRESTRRMSELLLKGATMTNDHCDACGSPIFRQNGQEFCPECDMGDGSADATTTDAGAERAKGAERPADAAERPADAASDVQSPGTAGSGPDGATSARQDTAAEPDTASEPDAGRPNATPDSDGLGDDTPTRRAGRSDAGATPERRDGSSPTRSGRSATPSATSSGDAAGDLAAGRDALATALRRHAEAAADETDPRTAADHLAAAREAAEALAALRR